MSDALISSIDLIRRTLAVDVGYTISHTQVFERRIADAAAAGADAVLSGAAPFPNMERIGLRPQFIRSLWTEL